VVLSVGLDPDLLSTRNLVLQSAGYTVVPAYSAREAADRFREHDFDLVLLCQSIPTKEKDRLTLWIRASGSRVPLVSVARKLSEDDASGGVTVDSEPSALLWGIQEVLINAKNPAAQTATALDNRAVDAPQRKKLPKPSTRYEQQTQTAKERFASHARRGWTSAG
jgi:CheY-like chemotaxis protein